jgi:hypothetical protein
MVDPVTVNRGLAQPTRGSDVGTWDVPNNGNFGLLDTILGGVSSIAVSAGGNALTPTQLANGTLSITGTLSSPTSINFPANIQGWWSIYNLTQGTFPLLVAAGTGTNVISVPPAEITDIQVNGNSVFFRNLGRIGSYLDYAGTAVPSWVSNCTVPPYLNCDGSTFSGGTYPYLVGILGGTTLPDLRGRARFYLNGGTGRITTAVSGINGDVVLSTGGDQNLFTHSHSVVGVSGADNQPHDHGLPSVIVGSGSATGTSGASFTTPSSAINLNTQVTGFPLQQHNHNINFASQTAGAGNSQNMPPTQISGICMIRAG